LFHQDPLKRLLDNKPKQDNVASSEVLYFCEREQFTRTDSPAALCSIPFSNAGEKYNFPQSPQWFL
jgi:hypothetical protein